MRHKKNTETLKVSSKKVTVNYSAEETYKLFI